MLRGQQLHLARGDFALAVEAIHLDPGECVGLIGPNGAGKSTLLALLAGRLRPGRGEVSLAGIPLTEFGADLGRGIGLVPDRLEGIQALTVAEHFAFRARFFSTWDDGYLEQLVRRLDLPLGKRLDTLSRGTRAKVAIAGVEASRPPVLLLDEPTTGLDPVIRGELRGAIRAARNETPGRAVLFSTHLVEDLRDLAGRVVLLRGGRVLADLPVPADASAATRTAFFDDAVRLLSAEGSPGA